ncbi:MAG: protein kinase [Pyrinomonadaceae bacterium]
MPESEEISESILTPPQVNAAETLVGDQPPLIGRSIGHYKIISLLGKGGMGEVYLAQDTRLGRKVALKLLPIPLSKDKERLRRFEREARSASALNHPNVCVIHEIGETPEGRRFIAMEYINGVTLRQHLSKGALTLEESIDVALQSASALAAAHEAGVVHRDIKPENLMLRQDGYVKVLDFGLAKLTERYSVSSDSEAHTFPDFDTHSGLMIGTISYLSPEQARREEVDERTDLWSLGVVLYEMLTGSLPFTGATPSHAVVAILEREPTPVTESLPGTPSELDWIITKTMRKDRAHRYQTARELEVDLGNLKDTVSRSSLMTQKSYGRARKKSPYALAATVAVLALVLVGLYLVIGRSKPVPAATSINSVAVLPFENLSGDANMDYLSDGITDSLINDLSQLPSLKVIGRSSTFPYKGQQADAYAVGQQLGVHSVLTGRIVERNGDLSIFVDLEDARDKSHIWGAQYNRKAADLLLIQHEISHNVTEKLRLRLSGEDKQRLAKRDTENVDAYRLYLKGRFFWNKFTREGKEQATQYFQQAINLDPNYALAYAGLADVYVLDSSVPLRESYQRAKAAAEKALVLDNSLGEAHATLGLIKTHYDTDWAGGEAEFKRAIELNPNYATAHHYYGDMFLARGNFEKAQQEMEKAKELDPLSPAINVDIGLVYFYQRDYDRCIEYSKKVSQRFPDFFPARSNLAWAYTQKKMYREAIAEYQQASTLSKGHTMVRAMMAYTYAVWGKKDEARKILKDLENAAKSRHISPMRFVVMHLGLGDKEKVFQWLQRAKEELDIFLVYVRVSPFFDSVRNEPKFQDIIQSLGLASQ